MAKPKAMAEINAKIDPALSGLITRIESLSEDPENARQHPERNLVAITYSLERFGQVKPIVATTGGIVLVGNGTLRAARDMGWSHIACLFFDVTEDESRLLALVDNHTQALSQFDVRLLAKRFADLEASGWNVCDLGWDAHEVAPLRDAQWDYLTDRRKAQKAAQFTIAMPAACADDLNKAIALVRETDPKATDAIAVLAICAWWHEECQS